jgi:hypothetical protein
MPLSPSSASEIAGTDTRALEYAREPVPVGPRPEGAATRMRRFGLDAWVASHQGCHLCRCGCGGFIVVKRHHHARGIPEYINGHSSRITNAMTGRYGALNPHFNHGRHIDRHGYVLVLNPNRTTVSDRYIYEHRLVLEQQIGRKLLSTEHVHHRNGDKTDNRLENLQLLQVSEHAALHHLNLRHRLGDQVYLDTRRRLRRGEPYKEFLSCAA